MNKHVITIPFFLFLIIQCYPGYGSFRAITIDPNMLRVGIIQKDQFPFVYFNSDNQIKGFDIDTMTLFQKEMGLSRIQFIPFNNKDNLYQGLLNNKIDCAASKLRTTMNDGQSVIYSHVYLQLNAVFLINRHVAAQRHHQTETPENFSESVSIGTLYDDHFYPQLRQNYPRNTIVRTKRLETLLHQVVTGQLEACVIDEATAKHYIHQHPEKALYLDYIAWPKWHEGIAITFSWENRHLRDLMNIFLQSHNEIDKTLNHLLNIYSKPHLE